MHAYDSIFYDYINEGATRSAEVLIKVLLDDLNITSVADFGCGEGAWLAVWAKRGVSEVQGVDGDYVQRERLLIPAERFMAADLTKPVSLDRKFDLVQSLEVAEHLSAEHAECFVKSLVAHGSLVMFSAAVPGQGGENHINERPYEYWQGLFAAHGYLPFDSIRPRIQDQHEVEDWYRFNPILFAHESVVAQLPEQVRNCRVPAGTAVPDISPAAYRLRKAVIRCLPPSAMTLLAVLKKNYIVWSRRGETRAAT